MSASRNEVTGDVIANVKGNSRLFDEGYDRVFGNKEALPEEPQVKEEWDTPIQPEA
jgi:hypothetical protein